MSLAFDRRTIHCDWCGCMIIARLPVALHPVLAPDEQAPTSEGWLYVTTCDEAYHFCSTCGAEYLKTLEEGAEEPPPNIRHLADVTPEEFGG